MKTCKSSPLGTLLLTLVFCFFIGGCVAGRQKLIDAGMQPLTDADFKALFSKPIQADFYFIKTKVDSAASYSPDGKIKVILPNFQDEGTYWIEDDLQCSKFKKAHKGAKKCYPWVKVGEGVYDVYEMDGSKKGTLTIKQ